MASETMEEADERWFRAIDEPEPQQDAEPVEGGGWEITDEDVQVVAHASPSLGFRDVLETIRDRLRARVQPRRVSREEFHAALSDAFGLSAEAEDTDRAGRRFMDRLGIEITPTEEDDVD